MKKNTKKWLIGSGIAVAGAAVVGAGIRGFSKYFMRQCKVPVLFIHRTDDSFVPVSMTYENYKACTGPKQLLIVPGAEHGMSYCVDKELYEETSKDFGCKFDSEMSFAERIVRRGE